MSDIQVILQNSILYTTGAQGLSRFSKATEKYDISHIVKEDGSLDVSRLMNLLLDVFPEEQASSIMDNVLNRYMEAENEEQAIEYASFEAVVDELPAMVEPQDDKNIAESVSPQNDLSDPGAQSGIEDDIATYFDKDAVEVRNIINEARRIRMAMGKLTPKAGKPQSVEGKQMAEEAHSPPPMNTIHKASRSMSLSDELLAQEIDEYVGAQSSITSIDPMDVVRRLKEKGYHFQENTVLEKVYTRIEERKNKVRDWILHDIQIFLEEKVWPSELEVTSYIQHIREMGIAYEDAEIRRMILVEMIRKA